jgi:hypothetical protein
MRQKSNTTKLGLHLSMAALLSGGILASAALPQTADATVSNHQRYRATQFYNRAPESLLTPFGGVVDGRFDPVPRSAKGG